MISSATAVPSEFASFPALFACILAGFLLYAHTRNKLESVEGVDVGQFPLKLRLSTFLWSGVYVGLLVALALWCDSGLILCQHYMLPCAAVIFFGCGFLVAMRDYHPEKDLDAAPRNPISRIQLPEGLKYFLSCLRNLLCVILAIVVAWLALELPWNTLLASSFFNPLAEAQDFPKLIWLELSIVASIMLALYLFSMRRGAALALGMLSFAGLGLAQMYLAMFKDSAIMPSDVLGANTGLAVAAGYSYTLSFWPLLSLMLCAITGCALAYVRPATRSSATAASARGSADAAGSTTQGRPTAHRGSAATPQPLRTPRSMNSPKMSASHIAGNLILGTVSLFVCAILVSVPNYKQEFEVKLSYWETVPSFKQYGFIPSFITAVQNLPVPQPEGYDKEAAQKLEASYVARYESERATLPSRQAAVSQFEGQKPTVIAIMNETFADLSIYDQLHCGYTGPNFFNTGMTDSLYRGDLSISVYGAGTCNSEFEFLTSNATAFIGPAKNPYTLYNFTHISNLASQLGDSGYKTIAMHPNYASNWNRAKVYREMGFDEFLDISAFGEIESYGSGKKATTLPTGVETFHNGVSDKVTYQKVLELLQASDEPQFIFDVTMQNHSGYKMGNIPEELLTHYSVPELTTPEIDAELNEYLSCIEESDRALQYFVEELKKLDRPVVLIFFGDHQPGFMDGFNDVLFPNENPVYHMQRKYTSSYCIWANYSIAGQANPANAASATEAAGAAIAALPRDDSSVDYLAALALEAIGAPLSDYQKTQLVIRADGLPRLNLYGFQDAERSWHATESGTLVNYQEDGASLYRDLSYINYLEFGSKV